MNHRTFMKALTVLPAATVAAVKASAEAKPYVVAVDPGVPGTDRSGMMIFTSTPGDDGRFYRLWRQEQERAITQQMGIPAGVWKKP